MGFVVGALGETRTPNGLSPTGFVDLGPIQLDDESVVVPRAGLEPAFRD